MIAVNTSFLHHTKKAFFLAFGTQIYKGHTDQVGEHIAELIFGKNRAEKMPLVVVAEMFEIPFGPTFVVIERVVVNGASDVILLRNDGSDIIPIEFKANRKVLVPETVLIELLNEMLGLAPGEYCKQLGCFLGDK